MKLIAAVPAGFCHGHVKNELPNFRQRKSPDVIAHSRIGSVVRDIPSAPSFEGKVAFTPTNITITAYKDHKVEVQYSGYIFSKEE